ncbi:MAG: hypothetical protein PHX51_06705 [Clostridia bacterium]|nr:hypothetical protein [Clostridia bacterium]
MSFLKLKDSPYSVFHPILQYAREEVASNNNSATRCLVEASLYVFKNCVDLDMQTMYRDNRAPYYLSKCPDDKCFDNFRNAISGNRYTHDDLIAYFETFMEHYEELYKNDSALRVIQVAFEYATWKPAQS